MQIRPEKYFKGGGGVKKATDISTTAVLISVQQYKEMTHSMKFMKYPTYMIN